MGKYRVVRAQICKLLAPILVTILFGCATKVPLTMLKPGNYHQAATAKTVAVLPFSGSEGEIFASEIEAVLAGIELKGQPYFTLVDRSQVDKVLSELQLSHSGLIDQSTAAKAGKLLGAQGIYTGTSVAKTTESSYKEKRTECAEHEMKRDKKGNLREGDCIRWNNYYIQCTKRVANFSATPKLISVNSSKILYSKTLSRQEDSSGCEDGTPPKEESELMEKAKSFVKGEFRKDIAPYYETISVKLLDSTDNIDSQEAKDLLKSGVGLAAQNKLDNACDSWGKAKSMAPNSASINYNLAVCSEATADYVTALKLYKEAERLKGGSDENIASGILRASRAIENQKKLDEQLAD